MYSSMWFMSIVALLVVDVRTGALQDRDIQPSRCYSCLPVNGSDCSESNAWPSIACPGDRPLCATVAMGPDFSILLGCAATIKTPCLLQRHPNSSFELTCVCNVHHCNAPFSQELKHELLNFTYKGNTTDITERFFKTSKFGNFTDENLYKLITVRESTNRETITSEIPQSNSTQSTTKLIVPTKWVVHSILKDSEKPKAEALKQEATVPSDDDEDENEGSGNYEDARSRSHSASAPAAPSSYLPADNSATSFCINLSMITLHLYFIV